MVDGFYSGWGVTEFRQVIEQWAQFGLFDVLLPLLLVFTLVFAILEKINIFKNRGVNLVIALVLAFFAVTNPAVSIFFMYLFSNLAIGVAVLLVMIILVGFALKPEGKTWEWVFGIGGAILLLVILAKSGFFSYVFGPNAWYWMQQNASWIILLIIIALAIIGVVVGVGGEKEKNSKD
ncbi:MAG: hypothetical protein N3G19_00305 [Candidatus Pacearchaeota archaeon]|nr:hypothetical protein [Candidatus Pacearchaeota archaeon]